MTYAQYSLVQALDYNTFANASANINPIWGQTASGNTGYGQSNIADVSIGQLITSAQWTNLIDTLNATRRHQVNANFAISNNQVTTANIVHILNNTVSDLTNAITLINSTPLNCATQGATSSQTATNTTSWADSLTFTASIVFPDANRIRWFFNSGGQFSFSVSHGASGGINDLISGLCNGMGTIWLSAENNVILAGTTWQGIQRQGGAGGTLGVFNGFAGLTGTNQNMYSDVSGANPPGSLNNYTGTNIALQARLVGATLTVTLVLDEVDITTTGPDNGLAVGTPTTFTVTTRQPETTNLTATWNPINISIGIVPA